MTKDKEKRLLSQIIFSIKRGGMGIIKTDTLYGIVASALDKKAVLRTYKVKGRDRRKPFIVLISSFNDLKKFGIRTTKFQKSIIKKIWPGPFSVIFSCRSQKFRYLHRGKKCLALRVPKTDKLRKFISATGPLIAPSANPQGFSPAKSINEARKYFMNKVDFYFNSGRSELGASTLIDLRNDKISIVRKGVNWRKVLV